MPIQEHDEAPRPRRKRRRRRRGSLFLAILLFLGASGALAIFGLTFAVMTYGVIPFGEMGLPLPELGWWFPELSALFLWAAWSLA